MRAHWYRERRWQLAASAACFLFGVAFTLNVHPIGDGLWFWYAVLWRSGQKLYADMHLPLQPLFVLATAWTQVLLGKGWLAGKVLAFAQVAVYCAGLTLVAGYSAWRDWQKAILIPAAFLLTITSLYSRFDDYHITGYIFEVWSIYLLLRCEPEDELATAAMLGVLSGLSISNRVNDGAALFGAVAVVLPFFATRRRLLAWVAFCLAAPLTLLGVIALTGDSVRDWAMNSIVRAAAIKGGTGNVLVSPLGYPLRVFVVLWKNRWVDHNLEYVAFIVAACVLTVRFGRRRDGGWIVWRVALALGVAGVVTYRLKLFFPFGDGLNAIALLAVPLTFLLSLWLAVQVVRAVVTPGFAGRNRRELLLLIPILQVPGTTLSSRGGPSVLEVYPQAALLLLLLPVALAAKMHHGAVKVAYLALAGLIAVSVAITKTEHPYYWHHFVDTAMFRNREWYRDPVNGPMYIERDQLALMKTMCADIGRDGPPTELLSITNPYPNWFCNVTPWHGYVQTWYDTVGQQTMDSLVSELQTAPPKWIIYQRAEDSMAVHELVFMNGRPLPHRVLDRLIRERIADGQWKMMDYHSFERADWFVIETRG